MNAKNRAYVFEVITPARHLCLSADEQKLMDLFVFYLQSQVRLSSDVIGKAMNPYHCTSLRAKI